MTVYAAEVREAVAGSIDVDKLAEAWVALHPKDVTKAAPPSSGEVPAAGTADAGIDAAATAAAAMATGVLAAFMRRARAAIMNALRPVMARLLTEAWVLGQRSAEAVSVPAAGTPAAGGAGTVEAVLHDVDWGGWTPGDYAAAEQIAGPGLRQLLGEAGITIKSIADSRLEELSKVLEDTLRSDEIIRPATGPLPPFLSVGDLASRLKSVLDNPDRAELVAQAEIARAQASAARQVYAETGRTEVEISTAQDDRVCAACDAAAALGPHPLGAPPLVPLHPRCRCAELPVLESGAPRTEPAAAPEPEPQAEPATTAVAGTPHIESGPAAGFSAAEIGDDTDAQRWLRDHAPELDEDQRAAVSWYTGAGYKTLNGQLRQDAGLTGDTADRVRQLDSAMSPLAADLVLTRKVGRGMFGDQDPAAYATDLSGLVGSLISDDGYLSTSLGSPSGAGRGGVLMHIAAPEGTPAIIVGGLSQNVIEREILLARGTRLAVSRMERAASGYGWEAWLTVVLDDLAAKSAAGGGAGQQAEVVFRVVGKAPRWAVTAWDAKPPVPAGAS